MFLCSYIFSKGNNMDQNHEDNEILSSAVSIHTVALKDVLLVGAGSSPTEWSADEWTEICDSCSFPDMFFNHVFLEANSPTVTVGMTNFTVSLFKVCFACTNQCKTKGIFLTSYI